MSHAVVIYHANCADGFGAAWAFHKLKESDYDSVDYKPMAYGEVPNFAMLNSNDCYILDFSFNRIILEGLCKLSKKVVLLDHHKTAQADLENWEDKPENLEIVFDMTRSGAGITWDYFATSPRVNLINYIEDRDLWKFKLPWTQEINAVIQNTEKNFEDYDFLASELGVPSGFEDAHLIGNHLLRQHDRICADIVDESCSVKLCVGGYVYEGLEANCTPHFSSEVGNLLAKKSGTFGLTYHYLADRSIKFSIRSNGDYDVSAIAKQFGGGGHKNASGWVVKVPGL